MGEHVKKEINIMFLESVFGCKKEIEYTRNIACKQCKGTRLHYSEMPLKCYTCGGLGSLDL